MDGNVPLGIFAACVGLFLLGGAVLYWEWFSSLPRVRSITWLLGQTGGRLFYAALGAAALYGAYDVATNPRHRKGKAPSRESARDADDPEPAPVREPKPSGEIVTLWNAAALPYGSKLSVDYRFDRGGPQRATLYYLIVESGREQADLRYSGTDMRQRGTLRGRVLGGRLRSDTRAYLATGPLGSRRRVSNTVTVRLKVGSTVARKPTTRTPPPKVDPFVRAMRQVKSSRATDRRSGGHGLSRLKPDQERRGEVSAALDTLLRDNDEAVRRAALQAAGRWHPTDALPAVAHCVGDRRTRAAAIQALAGWEPEDKHRTVVGKALAAALSDSDPLVRSSALRALARWHTPEAVPALIQCLEDRLTRSTAMTALAETGDPRAADAIAAWLDERGGMARLALEGMGEVGEKAVLRYVRHDDEGLRSQSIGLLREMGGKASYAVLEPLTRDADPELARLTAEVVAQIRLRHPDLPKPTPPTQAERLAQLMGDLDSAQDFRRSQALEALQKMAPLAERREAVALKVAPFLSHNSLPTQMHAVKALAVWHTEKTLPAIIGCADASQSLLRGAAFDALAQVKAPEAAKAVAAHLADDRSRASSALVAMGPVAEEAVLPYATQQDKQARLAAIQILGKIGTQKSIPTLRRLLKYEDGLIRSYARTAGRAILSREKK